MRKVTEKSDLVEPHLARQLTVSAEDERWGLYATGVGHAQLIVGDSYPAHELHPGNFHFNWDQGRVLHDSVLIYIAAGEGEFESERSALGKVGPGSVLLVPAGIWHRYRPVEPTAWDEFWVSFNGEFSRRLIAFGVGRPQVICCQAAASKSIESIFKQLCERCTGHSAVTPHLVAADVFHLIALVTDARDRRVEVAADSADQLIFEAVSLIWSDENTGIGVEELVGKLLVARRTLERAFRAHLAHGIHEEIIRCRLEKTTRLLADRSLSIEEVASRSGFGTVRSLRRAFTASKGMSPQSYRNLLHSDPQAA